MSRPEPNLSNKSALQAYCNAFMAFRWEETENGMMQFFAKDAVINVVHPFNEIIGPANYCGVVLAPLKRAFEHLGRCDYIAFGGQYEEAEWVTCTGYYSGRFSGPWIGLRPTGALAFLRFGEFHRMRDGQAVESFIFFDIPELMIAAGQWPIDDFPGRERGYTGYLPGPLTQDGIQRKSNDPTVSAKSLDIVTRMLRNLASEDQSWRPYWREDMLWYGPAAFGSFVGLENFAGFQVPFEKTFSEWVGGAVEGSRTRHFTRFADGNYVCSGGWPSLNAVQAKTFLGQPSKGKRLYMRVCDWWRRDGDELAENWVFVDIPHVLLQMDFDVFAEVERVKQ